MKKFILLFLISCASVGVTVAQTSIDSTENTAISKEYIEAMEKLMSEAGMYESFLEIIDRMIEQTKSEYPTVNDEFWTSFKRELKKTSTQDLLDKFTPIYRKYYTLEDLKALTVFYASPVGKKMQKNTVNILMDSQKIGREWG